MKLVKLPTDIAQSTGAVCLDGTPPAFYIQTNPASTKWIIFIQGGGWCYDERECLGRSKTNLGSSG